MHKGGLAPLALYHESQWISDFFFKLQNGIGLKKKKIALDDTVLKAVAVEVRIRTKCKIAFLYLSLMVTLSVVNKSEYMPQTREQSNISQHYRQMKCLLMPNKTSRFFFPA